MNNETEVAIATATAVIVRSKLPAWLRYGWAGLVTLASLGGWVVDHCNDQGAIGAALRALWTIRHPAPITAPAPARPPAALPAPGPGAGVGAGPV